MKTKEEIENELDKLFDNYQNDVECIARQTFYEYIVPFCKTKDFKFSTWNGDWIFSDYNLPDKLTELLNILIPGMNNNLGSLMPEWKGDKDGKHEC